MWLLRPANCYINSMDLVSDNGGGSGTKQFDFGELRFGTDWRSVLPAAGEIGTGEISMQGASFRSDKSFSLTFTGPVAQSYTVWATTNIALPFQSWTNIGSGTFSFDPVSYYDTNASNLPSRFYRITCP
jgi:hypothetical protein